VSPVAGSPERSETAAGAYPTIAAAVDAFCRGLVAKSPRTAANYASALRRLADYLSSAGLDPATSTTDQLPAEVLEHFYTGLLAERGRARRATAVAYVAAARAFVRFLDRRRWLHPSISYERVKESLREVIGRRPYPTPRIDDAIALAVVAADAAPIAEEVDRVARLTALRDRAILRTLYATGLRRAELAALNRADVGDGHARQALVTGKGERERIVFFDEPSLAAIRAYLTARGDAYRPLFLRHDDGRGQPGPRGERWRLSPQSVWGIVRRAGAAAGVHAAPHGLRHLKARTLLNQGAQLAEVQDLLGHASPETTKTIYAPYTQQHLREAFDRFSLPAEEVARRAAARRAGETQR
jgi:site-specific recombinase XerD